MSKNQSKAAWIREWIKRIDGNNTYSSDGKVIYCNACQQQVKINDNNKFTSLIKVSCIKYYHLEQHNNTAKHKINFERYSRASGSKQQFLTTPREVQNPEKFPLDLCEAFLSADIPFKKLDNTKFRKFLESYCKKIVPDESTLRKNYLPQCFENVSVF